MKRGFSIVIILFVGIPGAVAAADGYRIGDWWGMGQGVAWFVRGGLVMYPILACSIIGLPVLLERLASCDVDISYASDLCVGSRVPGSGESLR